MSTTSEAWVVVAPAMHQTEIQSAEMIGEAKRLMGRDPVRVLVVGHGLGPSMDELAKWGPASALTIDDVRLASFQPEVYARVIAQAIRVHAPRAVIFSGSVLGSDLGSRVAAAVGHRFHGGLVNFEFRGETIEATRPVANGRQHQTEASAHGPFLLSLVPDTVGPGAPCAPQARTMSAESLELTVDDSSLALTDLGFIPADPRTIDIVDAEVIVAGGRGVGGPEGFTMIAEVADQLGASVGASRPAVESGWAPYERQVGQTGRSVHPKVYIACGISGASQHLAGMRESATIITINTDSSAPIHGLAHLAIEGDLQEVLSALLRQLHARKRGAA
jgi:electron transfer flavoprotein alpha subunit